MAAEQQLERGAPMHERVYQRLRDMIIDGTLEPGQRLVETELAASLGVSRTPVREGIRRLLQENWVQPREYGGVGVRNVTARDLVDAYTARAELEALAARLACERVTQTQIDELDRIVTAEFDALGRRELPRLSRLNTQFHDTLVRLCGNGPLLGALEALGIHTIHYKRAILRTAEADEGWQRQYEEYVVQRIRDHAHIVRLLEQRDGKTLTEAVRQHVLVNADNLVTLLDLEDGPESALPLRQLRLHPDSGAR